MSGTRTSHTLNGALGPSSGQGAHCADHEVGKELVGALALLGHVFAKVWDRVALGRGADLERALVGGRSGAAVGSRGRGANGAHGGGGCSRSRRGRAQT